MGAVIFLVIIGAAFVAFVWLFVVLGVVADLLDQAKDQPAPETRQQRRDRERYAREWAALMKNKPTSRG